MPYDKFGRTPEQARRERVSGLLTLFLFMLMFGVVVLVALLAGCSTTLTADDDVPAYDYAGPDGTLTGVLDLADEIADVIQVACNLAYRYGIDVAEAMRRCTERQRARGRL